MAIREYQATFLWPFEEGSLEEAGFEFVNGGSEEDCERWWKILCKRAAEAAEEKNASETN